MLLNKGENMKKLVLILASLLLCLPLTMAGGGEPQFFADGIIVIEGGGEPQTFVDLYGGGEPQVDGGGEPQIYGGGEPQIDGGGEPQ